MSGTSASVWPEARRGAVSLTFDDGSESQLRRAFPILTERGLRATFYLVPKDNDYAARLAPWRVVHEAGHEIGNHSLRHVCTRNFQEARDATGRGVHQVKETALAGGAVALGAGGAGQHLVHPAEHRGTIFAHEIEGAGANQ